jgi:anthranilate phosphoribosyltransferase
MLSRSHLEDILELRLPDEQLQQALIDLNPEVLTTEELQLVVDCVQARCSGPDLSPLGVDALDCSGTGGSGISHFNTSTAAAFVLASGGVRVAKFGNRAASSQSGSFDFLEALGLGFSSEGIRQSLETRSIAFLFAPDFYPFLSRLAPHRKAVGARGFRTVFNFIGPLLNPVRPSRRLLGVSDMHMHELLAEYLALPGRTVASMVVTGFNRLDEIDAAGPSLISEIKDGQCRKHEHQVDADSYPSFDSTPTSNAEMFLRMVQGQDLSSVHFKGVCLNAGAGFYLAGKAATLAQGAELAGQLFRTGQVEQKIEELRSDNVKLPA